MVPGIDVEERERTRAKKTKISIWQRIQPVRQRVKRGKPAKHIEDGDSRVTRDYDARRSSCREKNGGQRQGR
jgi:hypothetical protein